MMHPEDVCFHNICDLTWKLIWYARCQREVPYWHEHTTKPDKPITATSPWVKGDR